MRSGAGREDLASGGADKLPIASKATVTLRLLELYAEISRKNVLLMRSKLLPRVCLR